ncbi:hypothetical protein SAFG77S_11863 [Streptomyces afghaniensis]
MRMVGGPCSCGPLSGPEAGGATSVIRRCARGAHTPCAPRASAHPALPLALPGAAGRCPVCDPGLCPVGLRRRYWQAHLPPFTVGPMPASPTARPLLRPRCGWLAAAMPKAPRKTYSGVRWSSASEVGPSTNFSSCPRPEPRPVPVPGREAAPRSGSSRPAGGWRRR